MRKSYDRYCYLLAMLVFILLGGEARAWGDLGHKVICEIAFRLVQADTRAAINHLMQLDSEFKSFSGPNGCDSLIFTFTITNTSAHTLTINFAGGAAHFVSGDPQDSFINTVGGDGSCGGFGFTLNAGASCTIHSHYITANMPDFNGSSGLNATGYVVVDVNNTAVELNLFSEFTIVDPICRHRKSLCCDDRASRLQCCRDRQRTNRFKWCRFIFGRPRT